MTRVVADTNVYISALNFAGTADEVLALGRSRQVLLCISPAILAELEGVLMRKFSWSARMAREAVALIGTFTHPVEPQEQVDAVREDEDDNRILECALSAQAQYIVSGDKHLLKLRTFRRISILAPRAFLETWTSS